MFFLILFFYKQGGYDFKIDIIPKFPASQRTQNKQIVESKRYHKGIFAYPDEVSRINFQRWVLFLFTEISMNPPTSAQFMLTIMS